MKNLKLIILLIFLIGADLTAEQPAWELMSMNPPRGIGGRIAVSKDKKIYIGSEGGVYYSSDLGKSWNNIFVGYTMPLYLNDSGILFCGNTDNGLENGKYSFFFSTDNGDNWIKSDGYEKKQVKGIIIDKEKKRLFGEIIEEDSNNIYISKDGFNWSRIFQIPNEFIKYSTCCGSFAYDSIFIALAFDFNYSVYSIITNDLGNHWRQAVLPDGYSFHDIFIKSKNEYYAASGNGIYFSNDFGETWVNIGLSGIAIYRIFIFENIIFANSKQNLYYSNDSGRTWHSIPIFNDFNDITKICYDINEFDIDNFLLSINKNGIYKSFKLPFLEESNNGFSATKPRDFVIWDSILYMSCWGMFKSTNEGKTFDYLGLKAYDLGPVAVNSRGDIFVSDLGNGGTDKGIFRSTDGGQTWNSLFNGFGPSSIIINKRDVIFAAYSTGDVVRSADNGNTWESMPVLASAMAANDEGDVFSFSYANPNGAPGCGINRTTDDGKTWTFLGGDGMGYQDPASSDPSRVIFNSKTKSGWWGWIVNVDHSFVGVFETTDNGRTWEPKNLADSNKDMYFAVAVDSLGCLISYSNGNNYGIYRSCDNGDSWQRMDTTGLKTTSFGPVGVSPDGHIYVFGATGGLYRSRDRFVSVQEQLKPDCTVGSYSTSDYFEFHYTNRDYYGNKITIFNILGEEVFRTSFSENDYPMGGTKQINISFLPEGVYFVRIGNRIEKFVRM